MSITAKKFLQLNSITLHDLFITEHAKDKIKEDLNLEREVMHAEIMDIFENAKQLTFEEVYYKGFRPIYHGRKSRGINSWYFGFEILKREMIAVISYREDTGSYSWITTLTHSSQSELLKVL